MASGPAAGRFSIALRWVRPAQPTAWARPVFTEMTSAFATPAR
jgi:hypothetical protein